MATDQICKLCGQVRQLCRSHIVPDFAYTPIKNKKNQIYAVGRNTKKVQTGHFERLLCKDCEALLSGYETKFKQEWMNTIPPSVAHPRTNSLPNSITVKLSDYTSFKLFHLSVFWRAAVSSGFKVDTGISLIPYEEEIARLIREGKPGQPGEFFILGALSIDDKGRPVTTVSPLAKGKNVCEGHCCYLMSYAYCDWVLILARPVPQWMVDLETEYQQKNIFRLLAVPHNQSKSFNLWVDILRNRRK